MCEAEWHDLSASNAFRAIASSIEGKWFATTRADALAWGRSFPLAAEHSEYVIEADIPDGLALRAFQIGRLDGIGKAYYFEIAELAGVNFRLVNP